MRSDGPSRLRSGDAYTTVSHDDNPHCTSNGQGHTAAYLHSRANRTVHSV
jgi:hypothetical protein